MDNTIVTPAQTAGLLLSLSGAAFLMATSGIALSPFFQDITRDLQTQLVAITNLLSVIAVSWGVSSMFIGAWSDRIGRRGILVAGVLGMGLAQMSFSQVSNYSLALLCMLCAGLSGGAYMGTVYAAVSDHVPNHQRGRALGWVITGQSMSLVLGVPLVALMGSVGGWRGAILSYGAFTALFAVVVWIMVPRESNAARVTTSSSQTPLKALLQTDIIVLLIAGIAERICFAMIAVYLAIYLQASYSVSLPQVALGLTLVALGNVFGNMLGGQLADKIRARTLIYALSALVTAALALPLMLWQPGLGISLVLGFCYSFSNASGRPALIAALSDVAPEVRGAVLGMNSSSASIGWLAAAALGGWLVTHVGFAALGYICAVTALLGATLGLTHWWISKR